MSLKALPLDWNKPDQPSPVGLGWHLPVMGTLGLPEPQPFPSYLPLVLTLL